MLQQEVFPVGEILVRDVSKIWGIDTTEEVLTLDRVSLTVRPGEFLVMIGPSGCGKSTLLNMIAGLDTPTSGLILHNGQPVVGPSPDRSLIFQQPSLLPWQSLIDNVAFGLTLKGIGRRERYQRSQEFLSQVGLQGFARKYPHQLSGGMQQRASIARALCLGTDILLMDEPFASLDVQTRFKMQELLLDIWKGSDKTVVFVTHHIDEAIFLADRVVILTSRPGRILDTVEIDMSRPRDVTSTSFDRYRSLFIDHLRSEVTKAFEQQELVGMFDTSIE